MKNQEYLYGWVAGSMHPDGSEMLLEGPARRRRSIDGLVSCMVRETIVFKTRQAAERALPPSKPGDWPRFVRGYVYSTPNPANAKGLPLISSLPAGSLGPFPID